MNRIEQAKELLRRTQEALDAFGFSHEFDEDEGEVQFRFEALRGMLIMALNDVKGLVRNWENELDDETVYFDEDRRQLREAALGKEEWIGYCLNDTGRWAEFYKSVGGESSQFTPHMFVDWLADNYPEELAEALARVRTIAR